MSILAIMIVSAVFLLLGGRFYAPVLAWVLGERAHRVTPATRINDGRDYVPTQTPIVFAHYYASIAGAGPILGPILAIYFGWLPALLWILFGGVFLGAVHDYVATHIAVREGGKNLAVVARSTIGKAAFVMMLVMLVALLVLVCAAFLNASATALTSKVSISVLGVSQEESPFRTIEGKFYEAAENPIAAGGGLDTLREQFAQRGHTLSQAAALSIVKPDAEWSVVDGKWTYQVALEKNKAGQQVYVVRERQAVLGGIASTSVIVITLFSPLLGFLYLKRKLKVWICSLLAVAICAISIAVGLWFPLTVEPSAWIAMISIYVLFSAGLPVWLFLQSRDFINVHILYVGMGFLVVALLAAAIRGGGVFGGDAGVAAIPSMNLTDATARLGPIWPVLFVTIACGAVSGFHSLCAGGTTCKQLRTEQAARHVGYYAMLLESFLAVCVICALVVGLSMSQYTMFCYPKGLTGNAVLTFAMAVGQTAHVGLGVPVAAGALGAMLLLEGFLVTTLDTAIRLTRYMIEEGWATFFGRYDVFAEKAAILEDRAAIDTLEQRGGGELTGAGGLSVERPDLSDGLRPTIVPTSGLFRAFLKLLRHYWINSGLAVALMLLLAVGTDYNKIWPIFGSANQLLAALTLIVATLWLVQRSRPAWYTLLPAIFMLITSFYMLCYMIVTKFAAKWPESAALTVTSVLVLAMTAGIVVLAIARWLRREQPRGFPVQG